MNVRRAFNLDDFAALARRRLPRAVFDFADGGADDEEGLASNRRALRRYRLVPRYAVDVSATDTSVTLFGRTYASPIGIAPMGVSGLFRPGAELMFAKAAAAANVPYVMSTASTVTMEQAAAAAGGNLWFQLYGTNTRAIAHDLIARARDAGVAALVVTVDTPFYAKRERNLRSGFSYPPRPTARTLVEALMRPGWTLAFLRNGGIAIENFARYAPRRTANGVAAHYATENPSADQTWHDLEAFRALWPGPLVVKGVLHPADAVRAADLGADGVYVSNHGARQLDRAPPPVEMLPLIREAVGGRVRLMMDSGVRRGADVLVGRCLGAELSFVGRPMLYAAVAAGVAGVEHALDILADEARLVMGQIGCSSLLELGPDRLFDGAALRFLTDPLAAGACPQCAGTVGLALTGASTATAQPSSITLGA